jgi:hypothetical protein
MYQISFWFITFYVVIIFIGWYIILVKGGTVRNEKQCKCNCDRHEPQELIIRFEEPLEIDINIKTTTPEPEVRGVLTVGPVSERKL